MHTPTCLCCFGAPVDVGPLSYRGQLNLCGRCQYEHSRHHPHLWTVAVLRQCGRYAPVQA